MIIRYDPQSNAADWRPETMKFVACDDGMPAWEAVPVDLSITMVVKSPTGCTVLLRKSTDGTGAITIRDYGFIDIVLVVGVMSAFGAGVHSLYFTILAGDETNQIVGSLPIYEGA